MSKIKSVEETYNDVLAAYGTDPIDREAVSKIIIADRQAFEEALCEALDSLRSDWREDKIDYQKAIATVRAIYQGNK